MREENSIKKNYLYSMFLQVFNILLPLISTPYISRVFNAQIIGEISFTQSIISYLILFGNLGTGVFAMRQIAYLRGDEIRQQEFISNIITLKLIIVFPSVIAYIIIIYLYKEYSLLFLAEGLYLLAETMSIEWYFSGNENFRIVAVRSFLVKLIGLSLILLFVTNTEDKYLYVLILSGSMLIGNIVMWRLALKGKKFVHPSMLLIKKYLQGSIILFLPQIAGSVYLYCDKIMIKFLSSGIAENGYYEQAQKIIRISITLITALPTVMLPRISSAYSQNKKGQISDYMTKSFEFVLVLGMPLTLGVIGISDNLVPWFFGIEYMKVAQLLKILAPIIFFNSLYNVIGYQYLLSVRRERLFTITIMVGACVNIGLNTILIPMFDSLGASMASVFAEITVTLCQLVFVWRVFNLKLLFKCIIQTLLASITMFVVIIFIANKMSTQFISTCLLIFLGAVLYGTLLFLCKNELMIEMLKFLKILKR